MRFRHFAVALLLLTTSAFADEQPRNGADRVGGERMRGRMYVLQPQHALSDSESADLAARGLVVLQPMSEGRYLVRRAPNSSVDETYTRVRSLEPLTEVKKIQPSAYRAAAQGRGFITVNVIFANDVTFEDARATIVAAGGAMADVLSTDFLPPQRIRVRLSPADLSQLAADERVLSVANGARFVPRAYNVSQQAAADVTPLAGAPYNLDGTGLVLSYFELGPGQASHPEFGGRLINEYACKGTSDSTCTDSSNQAHATHTAGTMIAAGTGNAEAKGVAPKATLHGYRALCDGQSECGANAGADWLSTKQNTLKSIASVADNNSWGVVLGWDRNDSGGWIWYGYDEGIGGYEFTNAAIDKAARVNGSLMVHSAGNEASTIGPQGAPYAHQHVDDNFQVIANETFCYSSDGTGNDCPAPCTQTPGHCEVARHPVHVPFGSVGLLASPKNILTVGATNNSKTIASFSSRGPTKDGRVKPEIVAPGVSVLSTLPTNSYGSESGTSMAAPITAGTAALLSQLWSKVEGSTASPEVLKVVLIAGAQDLGLTGPDYTFGFGFLDGKNSADLIVNDAGSGKRIRLNSLSQGGQFEVPMTLASPGNLRVVLGWADPEVLILGDEFADKTLVNDLDLKVIDPSGNTVLPYVLDKNDPCISTTYDPNSPVINCQPATRGVNNVDNTEEVEIANAPAGTYRVIVNATRIASGSQPFVLVGNGEIGNAVAPCVDATEPNDTAATAFGYLDSGVAQQGKICSQSDVDYFKIRTNTTNPIRVTVAAGDTPLRVTVTGNNVATTTVDVPANGSNTAQTQLALGISPIPTTDVLIKVEPIGTIGANASYTVTSTYTYIPAPRRRAAKG